MKKVILFLIVLILPLQLVVSETSVSLAEFNILAEKKNDEIEWQYDFIYEDLYNSGQEMTAGKEIELNPALFLNEDYLPLFRVNYITNDSTKPLNISISTEPFKNNNGHVLNVEYFMEDYFYVKKDNGEFVVYDSENEPTSEKENHSPGIYTLYKYTYDEFSQNKKESTSSSIDEYFEFNGIKRYIQETLHFGIDYDKGSSVASLDYESMKYSVTVSAKFTDDISKETLKNISGEYRLPITVTIQSPQ